MDFDFSQEQYMFRDTVRSLLADARSMEHLRAGAEEAGLWSQLVENGIFALPVPEAHGGMGLGFTDLALVLEEFGRALVPAHVTASILAAAMIARFGSEAQKEAFLPKVVNGACRLTIAFAEPTACVPDTLRVKATRHADGWRVGGTKICVAAAEDIDAILVAVRFPGDLLGVALVPPTRTGVRLRAAQTIDLAGRWCDLELEDVNIAREDVLGGAPDTAAVAALFDMGAAASALQMTGIAARALEETINYITQRKQFDQVIGSFQAIKHRCADMAVGIDASRSAAYYAAWALDEADASERARATSMAKSWCGEQARFACNQAIQLHGGIGFTWELGLHLFLRRLKVEEVLFGDADWHRERVIAETLRAMEAQAALAARPDRWPREADRAVN